MPNDRDLAQQWLADALICDENPMIKTNLPNGACDCEECRMRVAAAILDTPGVVVATSWSLHGPGPGRLVIELPIEPSAPVEPVKEEK